MYKTLIIIERFVKYFEFTILNLFRASNLEFRIYKRKSRGFTLLELLIVMGIIALLAGTSLTSLTKSRTQNALKIGAQEVTLALRSAESSALSVKEVAGQYPGYGVYVPHALQNEYWIFADIDEDKKYTPANDIIIGGKKMLPPGATIRRLLIEDQVVEQWVFDRKISDNDSLAVVYNRPTPKVYFSEAQLNDPQIAGTVGICVGTTDSMLSRVVRVWKSGHVSLGDYGNDCGGSGSGS